jgi:hypothetical protein
MKYEYLKIIKEEGEFDFEVSSMVQELSQKEYEELKSMLITAIGTMELMRRTKTEAIEFDMLKTLNEDLDDDVEMSNM